MTLDEHLINVTTGIANMMVTALSNDVKQIDNKLNTKSPKTAKLEKVAVKKVKKIIKIRSKSTNNKRIVPSSYSNNKTERSLGNSLARLKRAKNRKIGVFYPSLQVIAEDNNDPKLFDYVNYKEKSLKTLSECLEKIKQIGKIPSFGQDAKTNKFILNLVSIKSGKLQGIWYPEYDELAIKYDLPELFKTNIQGTMISADITDLMKFYRKHNRTPSQLSDNKAERDLYRKLIRLRQIKQGKTCQLWNPELDNILKKAKIKNFFTGDGLCK